jgi:hypothetical protein
MIAGFYDAAVLHDNDLIGIVNGGEPVGDDQGGPVSRDVFQGLLN